MCGILTYYKKNGILKEDVISAITSLDIIKHRGPDGEGLVLINSKNQTFEVISTADTPQGIIGKQLDQIDFDNHFDLLLGHRRLSIIDLTIKGHQPFFYQNLSIVFNGEIYNFLELKEVLIIAGFQFTTATDTEVILASYRHWGTGCFSKFNGMWSIAIYDFTTGELIVSNDRYGVKPLYHYEEKDSFLLFSETKQIMAFKDKLIDINTNVVDVFMDLGYLFYNDETFFKGINRYPSASYCKIVIGEPVISFGDSSVKYYELPEGQLSNLSEREAVTTFKALLTDAVKLRLRSDVEWGISLSGGLDSTSIAFLAKEVLKHHNFTTFSVVAEKGAPEDESYFIDIANDKLQSKNIRINPLQDFDKDTFLSQIYQIGAPVGDTSFFAQYRIKKAIKENGVTVLLSGQGGDEILAGYHHHFYKYITELLSGGKWRTAYREIRDWSALKEQNSSDIIIAALKDLYLTKKTRLGMAQFKYEFQKKIFATGKLNEYLKLDLTMLQLPYFLQADDSFSMAYGVETRNPFLDYRLVDFALQLPDKFKIRNGWQKWILRESISEMPAEIRYRTDKKGFSTPMKQWINDHQEMLSTFAGISDHRFPQHASKPLFKRAALGAWIQNFILKN